jgi:hypothetical protein
LSKYLGSHFGGQHGCGQHGLGSQQRGLGGHGSQQGSRSQQQLVKASAKAAIKPKPKNFFINTPVNLEFKDFQQYCLDFLNPFSSTFSCPD